MYLDILTCKLRGHNHVDDTKHASPMLTTHMSVKAIGLDFLSGDMLGTPTQCLRAEQMHAHV